MPSRVRVDQFVPEIRVVKLPVFFCLRSSTSSHVNKVGGP